LDREIEGIRRELLYQEDYQSNWNQHPKYKKLTHQQKEKNKLLQDLQCATDIAEVLWQSLS
jgi:hypothetical protein